MVCDGKYIRKIALSGLLVCVFVIGVSAQFAWSQSAGRLAMAMAAPSGSSGIGDRVSMPSDKLYFDFKNVPLSEAADYIVMRAGLTGVALQPGTEKLMVTSAQYGVTPEMALRKVAMSAGCGIQRIDAMTFRIVRQKRITLNYVDVDIRTVIKQITKLADASVAIHDDVRGNVNLQLRALPWRDALDNVVRTAGNYVVVESVSGILRILPLEALYQQRETRIFQLSYIQPPDSYEPLIMSDYAQRGATGSRRSLTFSARGPILEKTGSKSQTAEARKTLDELKRRQKIKGTTFTLFNALLNVMSPVGRFEYDIVSNSMIVTDISSKLVEVADVIRMLDVEPVQVFVDVKFVTTGNDNLLDFGVDFVGAQADQGFNISHNGGTMRTILPFNRGSGGIEEIFGIVKDGPPSVSFDPLTGLALPATADALFTTAGFTYGLLDFSQFTTILTMLKRDEESTVIQAPKLMTLDNHPATIFVGSTVRFAETFSQSNASGGVETGIREADNSPVETGIQLYIEPHVVKGTENIIMTIIPKDSALTGTTSPIAGFNQFGAGLNIIQLPQVDSRTLVTKLLVRSGQTIMLGGLIDERSSQTIRKIPFLGDIPFIGFLFKSKVQSFDRNNLVIFMTVALLRSGEDARQIYTVHRDYEASYMSETERLARGFAEDDDEDEEETTEKVEE